MKFGQGDLYIDELARRVTKYAIGTSTYKNLRNEKYILSLLPENNYTIQLLNYYEDPRSGPVLVYEYGGMDLLDAQPYMGGNNTVCQYILRQVRNGLLFLHQRNIAHLDVKPDNVVVDALTNVRIIDFGLSTIGITEIDYASGTVAYMAPEMVVLDIFRDVHAWVDVYAADVWSYGCLAFAMYFGHLLWEQASPNHKRFATMKEQQLSGMRPWESLSFEPKTPLWLQEELNSTLTIDPCKRQLVTRTHADSACIPAQGTVPVR